MYRLYADELVNNPGIAAQMFEDRAMQFVERLGWTLRLDSQGREMDEYDEINPIYLIVPGTKNSHAGSMRFLPTIGKTMISDHFAYICPELSFKSPFIWECSRFCLGRSSTPVTALRLMTEGALLMRQFGLTGFVAVYDRRMERIYNRIGSSPENLGSARDKQGNEVFIGLWSYSEVALQNLIDRTEEQKKNIAKVDKEALGE